MVLPVGAEAPDFALRDQHGATVELADHRGVRPVVLVFYPFAFSRVCTGEMHTLRDATPEFEDLDVALLGISCDPVYALRAFAEADGIRFPLLSDFWPHGEVSRAYGVLDEESGYSQRSTYVVDVDGRVAWSVHRPPGQARDVAAYLQVLTGLAG